MGEVLNKVNLPSYLELRLSVVGLIIESPARFAHANVIYT